MKTYPVAQVQDLIAHIREGKALCKHDIGHELPEVLEYLLSKPEPLLVSCDDIKREAEITLLP